MAQNAADRATTYARFQRKITILSGAGTFLDGFDLTVIAVAMPLIVKEWDIDAGTKGLVSASAIIGSFIGAVALGNLTDRFGRKAMYMVDLLAFVVFAALTAFSTDVWQLIVFRFLLGIGIGADYPISATLVTEFAADDRRGRHGTSLGAMWFVGAFTAYVVGFCLLPLGEWAWRGMLLFGALFALVVFFLRRKMPESPRWLVLHGRADQAKAVLEEVGVPEEDHARILATPRGTVRARALFSRRTWRATVFVSGFWFCYSTAYYGISMYTPTVLAPFTGGSSAKTIIGSGIVAGLGLVGSLIGMRLVDGWGRRPLILTAFAGLALALAVLALDSDPTLVFLVILFSVAVLFANSGPGVLNFVYPVEVFPTSIRATGHGFATSISRIGSILGVIVFPTLIQDWGRSGALWLFAGVALCGLLICLIMAPETKGRTLEDILDDPKLTGEKTSAAGRTTR